MTNKQQQHDANEQLPAELLQVAQRYASMAAPRPSSQQTRELIAQLQSQTLPESLDPLPIRLPRSGRRRQPVLEVLVAVALVGILIGGFVVLLSTRRAPGPAHVKPVPATEIVVSVEIRGKGIAPALVAQRTSDGKTLWTFTLTQQFGLPTTLAVQDQVVYAKSWQQVYALRATDGKLLWQENLPWYGPTTPGTPPEFLHDTSALLVVDHGMVAERRENGGPECRRADVLRRRTRRRLPYYQSRVDQCQYGREGGLAGGFGRTLVQDRALDRVDDHGKAMVRNCNGGAIVIHWP